MIERILVPVDGSGVAEAALPVALTVAERSGADIHLVLVRSEDDEAPDLARHAAYLETAVAEVRASVGPATSVSSVMLVGDAAPVLCHEAGSPRDLIIMASHGHGGLARAWLGSVTEAVLRAHSGPVVVAKPDPNASDELLEARTIRHIMVPLDGTGLGETAVEPALELARSLGASVTLFRAVPPSPLAFEFLIDTPEATAELVRQEESEAQAYGESIRVRFDDGSCEINVATGVHRSPVAGILDFAERNDVDLTVLASRVRPGVVRTLLGSVADKVLRASPTPVMVVRLDGEGPGAGRDAPEIAALSATPPPRKVHTEPSQYRHVMLPLDGSPTGERAIPLAATIAKQADATLHVVTVVETANRTLEGEKYLKRILDTIVEGFGCRATTAVRSGLTCANLLAHGRSCRADVTVMATHGRGGFSRAWLGSVATDFLTETDRPVILVPTQEGGTSSVHSNSFTRILIPLDGSAFAESCLEHAVMLGNLFDATYHLTRVVLLPKEIPARYFDQDLVIAKAYLEEHAERMRRGGRAVSTSALLERHAGPAILEARAALKCDSIAMTTSARSGIWRALFGSVADKVLRGGRTPMLLFGPSWVGVDRQG